LLGNYSICMHSRLYENIHTCILNSLNAIATISLVSNIDAATIYGRLLIKDDLFSIHILLLWLLSVATVQYIKQALQLIY